MKTVQVLLRENVDDLGRCGDVVRVAAGYRWIGDAAPDVVERVTRQESPRLFVVGLVETLHCFSEVVASAAAPHNDLAEALSSQRLQGRQDEGIMKLDRDIDVTCPVVSVLRGGSEGECR